MAVEEQTKKEQIINLAQNDPFLKISDIASYVKTTPRYVRTILSEANISLMKLRKRYAKSMERRLRLQDEERKKNPYPLDDKERLFPGEILLEVCERDSDCYRISQVSLRKDAPYALHEIITKSEYLSTETLREENSIYQLLDVSGELNFQDNTIRMEEAKDSWREDLSLAEGEMVIVAERSIYLDDEEIAKEHFVFDARVLQSILQGRLVVSF